VLPGCPQDYHPIVVPQKNLTGAVLRLPDALPTNVGTDEKLKALIRKSPTGLTLSISNN